MTTDWDVGTLLGTSNAYWRGCTLQAGVRLGLFTLLHDQPSPLETIAEELAVDRRGMEYLLNALCAMGLLNKKDNEYGNAEAALTFLSRNSPQYMGHIILHHHTLLDGWAQLAQAVTSGKPVEKRSYGEETERESFLMGMFNLAMVNAPCFAAKIDLSGRKRLLDLGGGPGTYAIHFCLANPDITAVIYDRPTSEPFARQTINSFDLAQRIDFIGGDFNSGPLKGGPYDVVWLSHILHSNAPKACQEIIKKCRTSMLPGSLLLIHDFILDNDKTSPEFPALFSLNMLINNPGGRSYSEKELIDILKKEGLHSIQRLPFTGPNSSSILCCLT